MAIRKRPIGVMAKNLLAEPLNCNKLTDGFPTMF